MKKKSGSDSTKVVSAKTEFIGGKKANDYGTSYNKTDNTYSGVMKEISRTGPIPTQKVSAEWHKKTLSTPSKSTYGKKTGANKLK